MRRRIVVPLDGSPLAELALAHAEGLARLGSLPIHLLRVIDDALPTTGLESMTALAIDPTPAAALLRDSREDAQAYLDATRSNLAAHGLTVDSELRIGRVVGELLETLGRGDIVVEGREPELVETAGYDH